MATATFEELVAEGESVPADGWDFSWFEGRATEERPSWGYARIIAGRMADAVAALDIQTGGGEVLAEVPDLPRLMAAWSWPTCATRRCGPCSTTSTPSCTSCER
jgi:hypothetical protein